jgi:hypothetical protein
MFAYRTITNGTVKGGLVTEHLKASLNEALINSEIHEKYSG